MATFVPAATVSGVGDYVTFLQEDQKTESGGEIIQVKRSRENVSYLVKCDKRYFSIDSSPDEVWVPDSSIKNVFRRRE